MASAQSTPLPTASDWTVDPSQQQQTWYEMLSEIDFDVYEPKTRQGLEILRRKVGFAMYGLPDEEPTYSNGNTGYSGKLYNTIEAVADCLVEVNKDKKFGKIHELDMAIVFVFVEFEKQLRQYPVFRVQLSQLKRKFVDNSCRVYSTWKNFLEENELPPGKFCWPLNGDYSGDAKGNVKLGWGVTPAATPERQCLQKLDNASSKFGIGTSTIFLVSMVTPVAAPVMAMAGTCAVVTGLYSAIRSVGTLADRSAHGQIINPLHDRQAAASWLCVAGSTAGFAAGKMVNRAATLAKSGQVMSSVEQFTCNVLNVTSLAVSATGIGFGAVSLSERYEEGELTPLDIFQFTASVLFFRHAVVNFQTASNIIKDTQKGVLKDYEQSLRSNRHRKQFRKLAKNTVASSENALEGNAKVIRSIQNIENKDDFFAGMVKTRKDLRDHKAILSERGNIIVDGGVEIHPMRLYELGKQQRQEFLSLASQAANGTISEEALMYQLQSAACCNTSNFSTNPTSVISETMEELTALSAQLRFLFPGYQVGTSEALLVTLVVDDLTMRTCSRTGKNHAKWWKLICKHVLKLVKEMLLTYEEAKQIFKACREFVNDRSFNLQQGIHMLKMFDYFLIKVSERYSDHINDLIKDIRGTGNSDDPEDFE